MRNVKTGVLALSLFALGCSDRTSPSSEAIDPESIDPIATPAEAVADAGSFGDAASTYSGDGRVFGVDVENNLVVFSLSRPGQVSRRVRITGTGSERVLGIDFRPSAVAPATAAVIGKLYGITKTKIYEIDRSTGHASNGQTLTVPLTGSLFGTGFNPTVDRLRSHGNTTQNVRLSVDNGMATQDTALAYRLRDSLMVARITNNLASVTHLQGDLAGALRLYRSALAGFQRLGDRRYIAETYHNLALAFRQAADFHEAESAAAQAIRHADVLDDVALRALAVTGRAELRVEQGETTFAHQELDRAGRLAREAGDHIGGAEVRRVRALAALKERRYERAAAEADAARTVALEHGSGLLAAECAAVAALAYRGAGSVALAAERRAHAMAGLQDLGATQLLERLEREWADSGPVGPPPS